MTTNGIHLNLPLELSNPPGPPHRTACKFQKSWQSFILRYTSSTEDYRRVTKNIPYHVIRNVRAVGY